MTKTPGTAVRVIGALSYIAVLILLVEIASYIALRYIVAPTDNKLIYTPPQIDKDLYDRYLSIKHPILGWTSERAMANGRHSATLESRPTPSFPNTTESCVSLYGDSFTHGDEVSDDQAWGNVLSELLECKVSNFASSGYGMDQALLRFSLNNSDTAPINILGFYPYNLLRNLNQYRPFLAGPLATELGLKPRFILKDDKLQLVDIPEFEHGELTEILKDPTSDHFTHDEFLPGSKYGSVVLSFPYSLSALRVVTSEQVINKLLRRPSYSHFYETDHPTKGLQITEQIATEFWHLSKQREGKALVLVFPSRSSYQYFKRTNRLITKPFTDHLRDMEIPYVDLHRDLALYLGDREYCVLLTNVDNCAGHYNQEGNKAVASILLSHVTTLRQ